MYGRDEIHPGLIVLPGSPGRDGQQHFTRAVIRHIVGAADQAGETPQDFMVNMLVDINEEGVCTIREPP